MRVARIEARGFRNLATLDLSLPSAGAVFLGPNGHGKTNLLELLYYPVLFRSFRGSKDAELVQWGGASFHIRLATESAPSGMNGIEIGFVHEGRRKRVAVDGAELERTADGLGSWLAVAFQPSDVWLVSGAASERRQYLDRVLSLSNPAYLRALRHYRAALDQRNAALRQRQGDAAWAFDGVLARTGAELVRCRLAWVAAYGPQWADTCAALGESAPVAIEYRGHPELAQSAAWPAALETARSRDLARGVSTVGPHRDDLTLRVDGVPLRVAGSTGQQRTAAVALKLCERDTLRAERRTNPVLLLDDVFAELDRHRQECLAARLGPFTDQQVFVTAPRRDELPTGLPLDCLAVYGGAVGVEMVEGVR
jgi:DNA replication and repair protein RecF